MTSHEGRVAVITGADSGFGRAIATELARRGADTIAVDLNPANETVAEVVDLGRSALFLQADVSQPEQVAGRGDLLDPRAVIAFAAEYDFGGIQDHRTGSGAFSTPGSAVSLCRSTGHAPMIGLPVS
jgi:NAD(P)-dependent dehydrogenase (short-subunit alcohol dehydrogenase family)